MSGNRPQATRGRPRKAEVRLLEALETLLARGRGFAAVTVDELVATAGIARSTFYLNYRDKPDLLARLLSRVAQEMVTASGIWFQTPEAATRDDLRAALEGIIAVYRRHRAVMRAVMDSTGQDASVASAFQTLMEDLCAQSRTAVAGVRAAGNAHPGATDRVADLLTLTVMQACHTQIRDGSEQEAHSLVEALTHICWRAIFSAEAER